MNRGKIKKLYLELQKRHGRPSGQWHLWCCRPKNINQREEVIIGAILTQNTNWQNVEKAIANLKGNGFCCLEKIVSLGKKDLSALQQMIRPAGFFNSKGKYLLATAEFFAELGGVTAARKLPLENLRDKLLAVKGIGPETADSVLNYALDKPVFVIDEYTRRLVKKKRLTTDTNYGNLQKLFEAGIKKDFRLYQDFHALIVINAKNNKRASYVENKN